LCEITFTIPDVIAASDLNNKVGASTDLAEKRNGSANLFTPIHPNPAIAEFNNCFSYPWITKFVFVFNTLWHLREATYYIPQKKREVEITHEQNFMD